MASFIAFCGGIISTLLLIIFHNWNGKRGNKNVHNPHDLMAAPELRDCFKDVLGSLDSVKDGLGDIKTELVGAKGMLHELVRRRDV